MFVEQATKAIKDLSRTVHDDVKEFKEATDQKKLEIRYYLNRKPVFLFFLSESLFKFN